MLFKKKLQIFVLTRIFEDGSTIKYIYKVDRGYWEAVVDTYMLLAKRYERVSKNEMIVWT